MYTKIEGSLVTSDPSIAFLGRNRLGIAFSRHLFGHGFHRSRLGIFRRGFGRRLRLGLTLTLGLTLLGRRGRLSGCGPTNRELLGGLLGLTVRGDQFTEPLLTDLGLRCVGVDRANLFDGLALEQSRNRFPAHVVVDQVVGSGTEAISLLLQVLPGRGPALASDQAEQMRVLLLLGRVLLSHIGRSLLCCWLDFHLALFLFVLLLQDQLCNLDVLMLCSVPFHFKTFLHLLYHHQTYLLYSSCLARFSSRLLLTTPPL